MNGGFLNSLRFQVTAAFVLVLLLFAAVTRFAVHHIEQHREDNAVLHLAGKLQVTARQLAFQGLNYKENAPRDYDTYYRDVRLYYRDLMSHVAMYDRIIEAFLAERLPADLTGLSHPVTPMLDPEGQAAVSTLAEVWRGYRADLMEQLGDDPAEPRLEWGAEYVIANRERLEQATARMVAQMQRVVHEHLEIIDGFNRLALVVAAAITLLTLAWLYLRVLAPLRRAVQGFRRVAQGDFGHELPVTGSSELAQMTASFNALSRRLNRLFRLMDSLQRGSDLEETLSFVHREFAGVLPMDWIGAFFQSPAGDTLRLETSHGGGALQRRLPHPFPMTDGALAAALASRQSVHVADLDGAAGALPPALLAALRGAGLGSVILLPFDGDEGLRGFLVFAAREPRTYTPEHLELLGNVAHLVTHSFAKTVQLAERARLAAIGRFTSGIVHEVRNPLATISMALEHFQGLDLGERSRQRAQLAAREAARMARLLEDVLLYSKPLTLRLEVVDLAAHLEDFLNSHQALVEARGQRFSGRLQPATVLADRDRLTQVLLNLARNACEAAPAGAEVAWEIGHGEGSEVWVRVRNGGEAIPPERLAHLTEPFYTTRPGGTGLGLGIVKRIVEAHGGHLTITSTPDDGTTVTFTLPRA